MTKSKDSKIVASFLSIKSEIPTAPLNQIVEKYGKVLCLPSMPKNDSGILVFKRFFHQKWFINMML